MEFVIFAVFVAGAGYGVYYIKRKRKEKKLAEKRASEVIPASASAHTTVNPTTTTEV